MAGIPLSSVKEPLNALYYGDGGTGKTTHICHMAERGKVLVFNAEQGLKSRALQRNGVKVENIEVYDGAYTYAGILAEWRRLVVELTDDPEAYAGVIWDSMTEIVKSVLEDVVQKAVVKDIAKGKERDEHFTALEDYGVMTEQVRKLVRKYRDLPCHFGVSALERRDVDQNDGKVVYRPAMTPGLITDVYGWFDVIIHTEVENFGEDQYCGLTKPLGKFRGKDRYKILPKVLVDPTFERMLQYVEEELTVKEDKVMLHAHKVRKAFTDATAPVTVKTEKEVVVNA